MPPRPRRRLEPRQLHYEGRRLVPQPNAANNLQQEPEAQDADLGVQEIVWSDNDDIDHVNVVDEPVIQHNHSLHNARFLGLKNDYLNQLGRITQLSCQFCREKSFVDLGNGEMSSGLSFVALSRVRSLDDLV